MGEKKKKSNIKKIHYSSHKTVLVSIHWMKSEELLFSCSGYSDLMKLIWGKHSKGMVHLIKKLTLAVHMFELSVYLLCFAFK